MSLHSKKNNPNIPFKLYTDTKTLTIYNRFGISGIYDEINTEVLDEYPSDRISENFWASPKLWVMKHITDPFIMMNGDILTKLDFRKLYDFACRQDSLMTVATKLISHPFQFGSVQVDANNYLVGLEEKPDLRFEILAGIYCMKPAVLNVIPDNEYFGIDKLLIKLLGEKQKVSRYLIREYWLDIGQIEDYALAREAYAENFSGKDRPAGE